MLGSAAAALLFAPVLASFLLRASPGKEFIFIAILKQIYGFPLGIALKIKVLIVILVLTVFAISVTFFFRLGDRIYSST